MADNEIARLRQALKSFPASYKVWIVSGRYHPNAAHQVRGHQTNMQSHYRQSTKTLD